MEFPDRLLNKTVQKYCPGLLFILAFVDSSFFALPVTTIFILQVLLKEANVRKSIIYVLTGTVIGSFAGYFLGHFVLLKGDIFFAGMIQSIMDHNLGFSIDLYYKIRKLFQIGGVWILLAGTFTPIPYGMFSISSGLFNLNIFWFLTFTIIGHSIKFVLIFYAKLISSNTLQAWGANISERESSWRQPVQIVGDVIK